MLARVLAWVVYVNLFGYTQVFQLGQDGCLLPNQNRPNSRFLYKRASRSQNSPISSICEHNAHWLCKCTRTEPSNMWTEDLGLFFYHSSSLPSLLVRPHPVANFWHVFQVSSYIRFVFCKQVVALSDQRRCQP